MGKRTPPNRRAAWWLGAAVLLSVVLGAVLPLTRPTTLVVAVAPEGGTEPALMRAYADALAAARASIRLDLVPYGGVRESAEALRDGRADLAVVRPDVAMPRNGLTLAVLRVQAVVVAATRGTGIDGFRALAGRRLGVLARRTADHALARAIVEQHVPAPQSAGSDAADRAVAVVPVEEAELAAALGDGRIDAVLLLTTPTTPAARRVVGLVRGASASGAATVFGVPDSAATLARMPRLQAVTVPAGTFGGAPRLPAEDVATVGASYRLVARASLSRSVAAEATQRLFEDRVALAEATAAAEDILPPAYGDTAEATSARLPIHPGALDYFEREQEGFVERYESWIYLVAIVAGGLGSSFAWLRRRVGRIRRERIAVATGRLLELRSAARRETCGARLDAIAAEVDDLAASIARHALNRPTEPRMLGAATVAIEAARSTVERAVARRGVSAR